MIHAAAREGMAGYPCESRAAGEEMPGGFPLLWLALSLWLFLEALVIPGHYGWPWLAASLLCQYRIICSDVRDR